MVSCCQLVWVGKWWKGTENESSLWKQSFESTFLFSWRLPSFFVLIHNVHSHKHTKVFFIRLLSNRWHDTAFGKFNLKTTRPYITSQFFKIFLNIYFLWKKWNSSKESRRYFFTVVPQFYFCCYSVTMFDSLWPQGLQPARPPCPSPAPRVYSNPCPSSQWCHPAISSSAVPFSPCLHSFPASGSFQFYSHSFFHLLKCSWYIREVTGV